MTRMKLTPAGRVVVFVIIAALVIGGALAAYKFFAPAELIENFQSDKLENYEKDEPAKQGVDKTPESAKPVQNKINNSDEINLSLDEWIG